MANLITGFGDSANGRIDDAELMDRSNDIDKAPFEETEIIYTNTGTTAFIVTGTNLRAAADTGTDLPVDIETPGFANALMPVADICDGPATTTQQIQSADLSC